MRRKTKFRLLLLLGILIFVPFTAFLITLRIFVYAPTYCVGFLVYCYLLYRHVYKGKKAKYPLASPDGKMDIYFPRTNIPRPIYEDVQRHPEVFKKKRRREQAQKQRKF